jgi:AcrR family transcriptional regulator
MDNKENLIYKALSLFAARGYDAVGVQEICLACNITKPTMYHYYNSKRGLLDSLLETYYPPFLEDIKHASEYHQDIILNLEGLANTFFNFALNNQNFIRFSLSITFSPPESEAHSAQRKYMVTIFTTIEELFHLSIKEHGNLRNKEKQLTASFIGLLHSYIGLYLSGVTVLNESIARAIVKQFMHGIFS